MGKRERLYVRSYTVHPLESVTLSEYLNVCHDSTDVPVLNLLRLEQFFVYSQTEFESYFGNARNDRVTRIIHA